MTVTSWFITLISMIVAIIALLPGFSSQVLSKKALELAEWTALKDYLEQCKADLKAGSATLKCKDAIRISLPPPPHIDVDPTSQYGFINATSEILAPRNANESGLFRVTFALVVIIILLCAAILVLEIRKTSDRRASNPHWDEETGSPQRISIAPGSLLRGNTRAIARDDIAENATLPSPASSLHHGMGAATGSQPFLNSNIYLQHREGRVPHAPGSEYSTHPPFNNNPSSCQHVARQCPYYSSGMLGGSHRSGEGHG